MAVKEELIKALIIQYDESIRLQNKLLDCGLAEALLNVIPNNMKNRAALTVLLNKRTEECERLKRYLETARDKVSKLFSKHEGNIHLKEFLNFAFFLSTSRDSDEDIDVEANSEGKNLLQCRDVSSKDEFAGELNRNNTNDENKSEVVQQFYEMTINLMSKLSIENKLNSDVPDEISTECTQSPITGDAEKNKSSIVALEEERNDKSLKIDNFSGKRQIEISRKGLRCEICGRKFSNKGTLGTHIRQAHQRDKPYECTECDKRFAQKHHRKLHILLVHNRKPQNVDDFSDLRCGTCSKNFSNKCSLKTHIRRVHHKEKPYECTECSKRFFQRSQLESHISVHTRESQKTYKFPKRTSLTPNEISTLRCDICGSKLSNKSNLWAHICQVHYREKPFGCTKCGKRFATNSRLKEHYLVHGLQWPIKYSVPDVDNRDQNHKKMDELIDHEEDAHFQCAHCDRRFKIKKNLLAHIHTKHFPESDKPFKCTICNKSFPLKRGLESHKLTHTWQKPFKCSVCDQHFKNSSNRFNHEKIFHEKGIRFQCELCDKGYWHKAFLIRHLRNNH